MGIKIKSFSKLNHPNTRSSRAETLQRSVLDEVCIASGIESAPACEPADAKHKPDDDSHQHLFTSCP